MRHIASLAIAAGCFVPLLASAPASAQATRTWVSGVGDDVNPCSRTAPCKTFAGAISKTAIAGEINCLDPGGMGTVTITKSMTINCVGTFGSILASGVPGITVNATAAGSKVHIRGLQINGVTGGPQVAGTIGVRILAADVVSIEDTVITQFAQSGILDSRTAGHTKLFIRNSIISSNTGTGINLGATNLSFTEIENVSSINNLFGLAAITGNSALIRRSVFSSNTDTGIEADAGAQIDVDNSAIGHNVVNGIQPNGTIRLSNSDLVFNTTAVAVGSTGGTTYGNNRIAGNGATGPALVGAVPGQQ